MADIIREDDSGVYRVVRVITTIWLHVIMPVQYHHPERLKGETPFVVIANHQHALDPFVLAYPVPSQCVFLGKKELAKNKLMAKFLYNMHCIPVDRHNGDMEAMRACMKTLRNKKALVIFPEGTRHHEGQMEQIENGTALIVMRGKVPLIPVYLDRKLRLFRRTHAWVGEPIFYDDLLAEGVNNETCEKLNERMRETFRKMIREGERKA